MFTPKEKINFILEKKKDCPGIVQVYVKWNYGYKLNNKLSGDSKPIYLPLKMATGIEIQVIEWDATTQRLKENIKANYRIKFNSKLDRLQEDILQVYHKYLKAGQLPSPLQLKRECGELGIYRKPEQLHDSKTRIVDYVKKYIADHSDKAVNTMKSYKTLYKKIEAYEEFTKVQFSFEDLNTESLVKFFNWIQNNSLDSERMSLNAMYLYKKLMRKFIKLAQDDKIKIDVFYGKKNTKLRIEDEDSDNIYIDTIKLNQLINLDLIEKNRPGLLLTKHLTILACLTGLRFSDWARFGKVRQEINPDTNEEVNFIQVRNTKTDELVNIPAFEPLLDIYKYYGNKFPEPMSNQKFNTSVKVLGKVLEWDEPVHVRITRSGKKQFQEYLFYELLSSHTGRRSFCSNSFKANVDPELIMKISGHQNQKDFFKYIKCSLTGDMFKFYDKMKSLYKF